MYYSHNQRYDDTPETFTYYYKAASAQEVARATGFPLDTIAERTRKDIQAARANGKHIDIVVKGRLIETA